MSATAFDFSRLFAKGLPEPAARFAGYPKYNFIGGHNDPVQIPIEGLIEAAAAVLQAKARSSRCTTWRRARRATRPARVRRGQGDEAARDQCGADDMLITAGSGQGIELVERGDAGARRHRDPRGIFLLAGDQQAEARGRRRSSARRSTRTASRSTRSTRSSMTSRRKGVTPKYIYTIPTIQNPTGSIMPLERRPRCSRWRRNTAC